VRRLVTEACGSDIASETHTREEITLWQIPIFQKTGFEKPVPLPPASQLAISHATGQLHAYVLQVDDERPHAAGASKAISASRYCELALYGCAHRCSKPGTDDSSLRGDAVPLGGGWNP